MSFSNKFSELYFFIRRPNLAIVISLLITLIGAIAIFMLPIEQYPNLTPPRVFVKFSYPGASAKTISETVIAPLEVQLNGVEGMLYMTSTASSSSGTGTVNVFFALGTDPDIALVNVNNKVNLAQSLLPETVRQQGITVNKSSAASLLTIALFSPKGQYDVIYLDNYLQTNIVEEIKRIPGVGECIINGSMDFAMRIWLDPGKMAKYNIIPTDVAAIIRDQNAQFSPGRLGSLPDIVDTELSWQIDTQGRLVTPEEFGNIIIRAQADGSILRLKDIARVGLGSKNYNVVSSLNGKPARMAEVSLLPGANALETGKLIEAKLEELSANFPNDIAYSIPYNTNIFVQASIEEIVKTFVEAMVLVFFVVYIFLQNWRATLIPCLAVPVSIIGTFAGLYILDYSINMLTLFGLVLSIGIVVDDAIVVLENVERIMRTELLSAKEATSKAMSEVTGPIIAIVLVLSAVFIPVMFIEGIAG